MKKKIANSIMVISILLIVLTGIFITGNIRGWFNKPRDEKALLTDYRGIITIERDGVAYTETEDVVLRKGDTISCAPGASVKIVLCDGYVVLGENAKVSITEPNQAEFSIHVTNGEVFANVENAVFISFEEEELEFSETVALLSVRNGAQSISVYYGTVGDAKAGQMVEWINNEKSIREISIQSLNAFNIDQIRNANQTKTLFYTNADLDQLEAERREGLSGSQVVVDTDDANEDASDKDETNDDTKEGNTTEKEPGVDSGSTGEVTESKPLETVPKLTCTITIRCDTILDNWSELDPSKGGYVPQDGCILPVVTVEFTEGETVFEVLERVCKQYNIQLEYSWTPMYNSYYIEGINHLYEFDCGYESGWMYKVNGWFPNYGCSSYKLVGGENIVWCFTCKGLGEDVGAGGW